MRFSRIGVLSAGIDKMRIIFVVDVLSSRRKGFVGAPWSGRSAGSERGGLIGRRADFHSTTGLRETNGY